MNFSRSEPRGTVARSSSGANTLTTLWTAGITDAEIAAVARSDGVWNPPEAALLRAADELHSDTSVDDETWAALSSHFDTPALVEVLFIVGQYTMLSMVANATGIALPHGLDALPTELA